MFGEQAELGLLPEHITQCWGLSKCSVDNELKNRKAYFLMDFPEFLELFARIAEHLVKDDPDLRNAQLTEKIKELMDAVFPQVGQKRKQVVDEVDYFSVSEEEMDEE